MKERRRPSLGMKEESPKHGCMAEEVWRVFAVYFRHSEGCTPRNEALMEAIVKQARITRHLWLFACDANMDPENVKKSTRYRHQLMFIEAPRISTCRSTGSSGDPIERTSYYVIASQSLRDKSRPCKQ